MASTMPKNDLHSNPMSCRSFAFKIQTKWCVKLKRFGILQYMNNKIGSSPTYHFTETGTSNKPYIHRKYR